MFLSKDLWPRLSGRQVAQSVERRTLKQKSLVRNPCWAPGGGVGFHLSSPIRRAVRRRRPHYSQSGDPQFPGKKRLKNEIHSDDSHIKVTNWSIERMLWHNFNLTSMTTLSLFTFPFLDKGSGRLQHEHSACQRGYYMTALHLQLCVDDV